MAPYQFKLSRMFLGLLLGLLIGVCGCGREPESPEQSRPEKTEAKQKVLKRSRQRTRRATPPKPPAPALSDEPAFTITEERTPVKVPFHIDVTPSGIALILTFEGRMVYESDDLPEGGVDLELVPGRYEVMVNKAGWKPLKQKIKVLSDTGGWSATLEKVTGKLVVKSNIGTAVKVITQEGEEFDLGVVGKTGKRVITTLSEGAYLIVLSKVDYFSYTGRVEVVARKPVEVKARLDGMPGQVRIGSSQDAEIWEGEMHWGKTGVGIEGVTPGRHRIALVKRGFRTEYMDIFVHPNQIVILTAPTLMQEGGTLVFTIRSTEQMDTFLSGGVIEFQMDNQPWKQVTLPHYESGVTIGSHTVNMRVAQYVSVDADMRHVEVRDERTNEIVFVFQPRPVNLRLLSNMKEAVVFIENERVASVGEDILLAPFEAYTLEARVPGYEPVVRKVRFEEPGQTYTETINFDRPSRFADLISVNTARPVIGRYDLAPGSLEAAQSQIIAVRDLDLTLEVKTQKSSIHMRLVPVGSFKMGSDDEEPGRRENEGPISEVTFTKPMYVGKYEITQAQWERVMGENPASFKNAGPDAPVETIDWQGAQEFVNMLCGLEGVPSGTYRLLTEAEWEYCCRAGSTAPLYTGELTILGANNAPELDGIAWYGGNSGVEYSGGQNSGEWAEKQYNHSRAGTHPVGQKIPNAFGLYDMLGNVWEWCFDRYSGEYLAIMQVDPEGPSFGAARVCRGGGWYSHARKCRSAQRYSNSPRYRSNNLGLRVVRTLPDKDLLKK